MTICDEYTPVGRIGENKLKCFGDLDQLPHQNEQAIIGIFERKIILRKNIDDLLTKEKALALKNPRRRAETEAQASQSPPKVGLLAASQKNKDLSLAKKQRQNHENRNETFVKAPFIDNSREKPCSQVP